MDSLQTNSYVTTAGPVVASTDIEEMDATWILATIYIIFSMHTGFGLLEAGFVQPKNEANAMLKCAGDVVIGGLSYWLFGYGLSFGPTGQNNPFCGEGNFLVQKDGDGLGRLYIRYLFQLAFALTSTTIVSGAVAERVSMTGKFLLSFLSIIVYVIPAHWMWGENGWLLTFGALDFAGSGVVHLSGAMLAIVAAKVVGPRTGRYDKDSEPQIANANQLLVGTFILWWGWFAFNSGSSFGIREEKWQIAAKAGIATINASFAAGTVALIVSYIIRKRTFNIADFVTGLLGGLVAITAGCSMVQPWEGIIIGAIASVLSIATVPLIDLLKIDDPVGAFAVHGTGGIWGMLAVGFFADVHVVGTVTGGAKGLFHGGSGHLLLAQFVAVLAIIAWSGVVSFLLVIFVHLTVGLRQTDDEQEIGADYVEHDIVPKQGIPRYSNGEPIIERYHVFTLCKRRSRCRTINHTNENQVNEAYVSNM